MIRDLGAGIGHVNPDLLVADAGEEISTQIGRRFQLLTRDYLAGSYPITGSGRWIGKVDGKETDMDAVAETLEEGRRTSNILCECRFTRQKTGFSAYDKLKADAAAARCEYNRRLAIASGPGFEDGLREWSDENGEPWLIGLEKIFGLEPPDPLRTDDGDASPDERGVLDAVLIWSASAGPSPPRRCPSASG